MLHDNRRPIHIMMSKRRQMQKVYVKLKNRSNAPMVVDVIMVLPLWRWVGVLTGDGMRELSGIMEMLNVLI